MTRETQTDAALDALFAEARSDGPDRDLMARVLADADAVQGAMPRAGLAAAPAEPRGWLARAVDMVGGWGAFGGVTAAGVMGLAIGLYAPDTVGALMGAEVVSLDTAGYDIGPDMSALWLEGDDV